MVQRIGAPQPEEPVMNPSERRNDNFEDEHDDEDEYDLRGKRKGDRSKSRGSQPEEPVMNPSERRNDLLRGRARRQGRVRFEGKAKRGQVKISRVVNSDPDRQRKLWT